MRRALFPLLWLATISLSACTLLTDFEECEADADCGGAQCTEGICVGPPSCDARADCASFDPQAYCLSGVCRTIDAQTCSLLGAAFDSHPEKVIIPIGAAMPLTGENASKGQATINGAELALHQINAIAGGSRDDAYYGLISCDTAYLPSQAADVARYLHQDLAVQGLVGAISSAESIEVVDTVARQEELLVISPASTSPGLSGRSDFFWRTIASDADQADALGTLLHTQGLDESVAVLYAGDTDPYGAGFLGGLNTYWAAHQRPTSLGVGTYAIDDPAQSATTLNHALLYGDHGARPKTIILIGAINALALLQALEQGPIAALPEDQRPTWVLTDALRDQALLENDALAPAFPRITGTIPARQDTMIFTNYVSLYQQRYMSDPLRYQFPDKAYDAAFLIALAHEAHDSPRQATAPELVQVLLRLSNAPLKFDTIAAQFSSAANELNAGRTISLLGVSGPMQFSTQRDLVDPAIVSWTIDPASKTFVNGGVITTPQSPQDGAL